MAAGTLTRESLREIALAHAVCPYYLGQEVARWCDVVVGDYNHYFDSDCTAARPDAGERVARGRARRRSAQPCRSCAGHVQRQPRTRRSCARCGRRRQPALKKPLDRLHRSWTRLTKTPTEPYTVLEEPPRSFASALQDATAAISEHLADSPAGVDSGLLQFYFDALQFTRLLDTFGTHSLFDVTREADAERGSAMPARRCACAMCAGAVPQAALCGGPLDGAVLRDADAVALLRATRWGCPTTPRGSTWRRHSRPSSCRCASCVTCRRATATATVRWRPSRASSRRNTKHARQLHRVLQQLRLP